MTFLEMAAHRRALSRPIVHEALTELVATAFLLIAVVGTGIMAEKLAGGNVGLALLANAIATGGALVALILAFGPCRRPLPNRIVRGVLGAATLLVLAAVAFDWLAPVLLGA